MLFFAFGLELKTFILIHTSSMVAVYAIGMVAAVRLLAAVEHRLVDGGHLGRAHRRAARARRPQPARARPARPRRDRGDRHPEDPCPTHSLTGPEYRAHFDAHVEFVNGGSLSAEGFRLDLPSRDVDPDEVGRLFVQHLGLALVGSVELHDLEIVEEPHRGSRGIDRPPSPAAASGRRVVDLSHVIREGLDHLPGPARAGRSPRT